ncbi:MAG TPA: serine hydrolase domain-containing protein [Chitinophagaceae bacterium]
MKKFSLPIFFITLLILSGCRKDLLQQPVAPCSKENVSNSTHPMKDSVEAIIARYIAKGIPGIQVTLKNNDGWYSTAAGYASLETKAPLQPCTPGWLFSLTKAYTASLVMKQHEKGTIDLEAPIRQYLPSDVAAHIKGSDKVTVRMLLHHSSGIINFTDLPEYMTGQFNNPADQPSIQEMLRMVYDKDLLSDPGTKYFYSNTNYLLLYVILETVTVKPYQQLLQTDILNPLQLRNTYYNVSPAKATALNFPNYYFDRYAKDQLENVTLWNHYVGNASYGWGGIAATPTDAIRFYEALMQGSVVSASSLQQMTTWFQGSDSDAPNYGLGIEYWQFHPGSTPQRGHEGDGIGNSTMILYVPDNHTYLFINCTAGRKLFGPYLFKITDFKNELGRYVARWR